MTQPDRLSVEEVEILSNERTQGEWFQTHHIAALPEYQFLTQGIWAAPSGTQRDSLYRNGESVLSREGDISSSGDFAIMLAAPKLARQLLDTMRENEELRNALSFYAKLDDKIYQNVLGKDAGSDASSIARLALDYRNKES